ncbi:hypothetical protein V1514DRAFT_368629 [Lipomyces japonicus]|uniref:uncharacterized protein n=1 Tax=Lipomyces japonicus TaxID=56871 RepID=UPI0034CD386B
MDQIFFDSSSSVSTESGRLDDALIVAKLDITDTTNLDETLSTDECSIVIDSLTAVVGNKEFNSVATEYDGLKTDEENSQEDVTLLASRSSYSLSQKTDPHDDNQSGSESEESAASSISNMHLIYRVNSDSYSMPSINSLHLSLSSPLVTFENKSLLRSARRRLCIEEFIRTEESHLSGLRILVNMYFSMLESCGRQEIDLSAGIKSTALYLLELHHEILSELYRAYPTLYAPSAAFTRGTVNFPNAGWEKQMVSPKSSSVAAMIGKILQQKVSHIVIYQQYCVNYHNVIQILKNYQNSLSEQQRNWVIGCQNLMHAVEISGDRPDLSLGSLALNPITRFLRYRLLLQELINLTPAEDNPIANQELLISLSVISNALDKVNDEHESHRLLSSSSELWTRLHLDSKVQFDPCYLGRASLCGALHVTWREKDGSIKSNYMGCFLFKSYIAFANVHKADKYSVKFLLSLTCAGLVLADDEVGLQTASATSFKLAFEFDFAIYELLLTAVSEAEKNLWEEEIRAHICFNNDLNGYKWDFSFSEKCKQDGGNSTYIPIAVQPLFVSQNKNSSSALSYSKHWNFTRYSNFKNATLALSNVPIVINIEKFSVHQEAVAFSNKEVAASNDQIITSRLSSDKLTSEINKDVTFKKYVSLSGNKDNHRYLATISPISPILIPSPIDKRSSAFARQLNIQVKLQDRLNLEKYLRFVWSNELDLVYASTTRALSISKTRRMAKRISSVGSGFSSFRRKVSNQYLKNYVENSTNDYYINSPMIDGNSNAEKLECLHDTVVTTNDVRSPYSERETTRIP